MTTTNDPQTIDLLIAEFFRAFDNRGGGAASVDSVVRCFTDKAVVARRSAAGTDLYTVEEFARPRVDLLNGGALLDFHEWETGSTQQVFDGIAVRVSRYSKSGLYDGKDYRGSGTKCFQLVAVAGGWRIASLAWVDDAA